MALRKSHLYASLWQSCAQLRGGMEASQYKDYVLTLLFMKYVSDKYADDDSQHPNIVVPMGGGFADMVALKGTKVIGDGINEVIGRLAEANGSLLGGVIDQVDFNDESKLGRGREKTDRLTNLVGIFEGFDFRNIVQGDDILGDAYEYLMRHFAIQSGKSKGQFYTPAEVSRIMAMVIGIGADTTSDRSVYDPACGSGSLLVKASGEAPQGLTIFGQEMDLSAWTLSRMNMILHGHTEADIEWGNTLTSPRFTDEDGLLQLFDFAVANPPFSTKAWTNGLDPAQDKFCRFEYGIPPTKNGDYAFLLHFIASLKSTGKGAIILPHGVLFRGNREAFIRRNLVGRGLLQGVIGLPANLFYGTGIPACIVVIDKEDAATRDGIFMIDASRGFRKDGAKNRLRERDIHCIVEVFNNQRGVPGYARMVPMDEIASESNDYNLNIPRYIDSGEPEDLHDLGAHLHGGIPNRDIDALGRFWKVFPGLRERLFALGSREGYGRARAPSDEVRAVVHGHDEFRAYADRIRSVFDAWRRAHAPRLLGLGEGDSPKTLIRDLSQDLLNRFADIPLLDGYDVYQCLMDYWDEVMQDDAYLVVTEGWTEAARPRILTGGKGEGAPEPPDLTVRRAKYKMDLLPPALVVARYFPSARGVVERLVAAEEAMGRDVAAFVEENAGEDGALNGMFSPAGKMKMTQAVVKARLRVAVDSPEDREERDLLEVCLGLMEAHANAKRTTKADQSKLGDKVLARYSTLSAGEVANMVVADKWMADIEDGIMSVVERLSGELVDRVIVLEERYAVSLPELERQTEYHTERVKAHLKQMTFPAIFDQVTILAQNNESKSL